MPHCSPFNVGSLEEMLWRASALFTGLSGAGREREGRSPKGMGGREQELAAGGEVLKLQYSCHLATAGLVKSSCHTRTRRAERHSAGTHSCSVLLCADKVAG